MSKPIRFLVGGKVAHLWTGDDTYCRMASTGGLNIDHHMVSMAAGGLPYCKNCLDVLAGENKALARAMR